MTLIFIVGLASQIWCLLNSNQAGTWQKNVPLNNALSYMVLYEIFPFWENMEALRWCGVKHGHLWDDSLWSVISIFLLCTPSCSILPVWAVCWRPFLPGSGWVLPNWTLGWDMLNTSFNFCPVFAWQSPGISCGNFPWRAVASILQRKGTGFWWREKAMVPQPDLPRVLLVPGPFLPPLSLWRLTAIRSIPGTTLSSITYVTRCGDTGRHWKT